MSSWVQPPQTKSMSHPDTKVTVSSIRVLETFLLSLLLSSIIPVGGEIRYTISEDVQTGHVLGQILSDSGLLRLYESSVINVLQYTLMSRGSLPTDFFKINNKTSELSIARHIDRDNLCDSLSLCCEFNSECQITLSVAVQPSSGSFFLKTYGVAVTLLDVNDNSPKFDVPIIQGHISEAAAIGSTVTVPSSGNLLLASDRDSSKNGIVKYTIISPTKTFGLRVEEDFGTISDVAIISLKELDREKIASYKVIVVAHDAGRPPRSGSVTVNIQIDDANDNPPRFTNDTYQVWIEENVPVNSSVITVHATDEDAGENARIEYAIRGRRGDVISRLFTINRQTGEIRTKGRLNYETFSTHRIVVEATDKGTRIQRKTRASVIVNLRDVNDHPPNIEPSYLTKSGRAEVSESAPIGKFVAYFLISDPDNDPVDCEIDSPMFRLTRSDSKARLEYHLLTAHKLNREMFDEYQVTLTCTDQGKPQLRTAETFTVYVLDANDNVPKFTQSTYTASVKENNRIGVYILTVTAVDADTGDNARIFYSLDETASHNFTIDSSNGRIYARKSFDREEYDQIHFRVTARDNGSEPQRSEANVVIRVIDDNDNAPQFHPPQVFEISEAAGAGVMLGQMRASDPDVGRNAQIHFDLMDSPDARAFRITKNGIISTSVQLDREKQKRYHIVVIARDNGTDTIQTSSASVRIDVTDINDNPPIIHFPNTYNNTVYISYLEPIGHTVITINATDEDEGKNAFLDYSFTHGNEENVFKLNQNTGAIYVAKQMKKLDALVYKLGIRVMDKAEPYNGNVEILNIVIDGTGKAIALDGTYLDSIASNRNLIIVICLAGVSGILVIILVVAIVCIRKKDREHHRYSVTETDRIYEKCASVCSDNDRNNSSMENKFPAQARDDTGFRLRTEDGLPMRSSTNGHSVLYSTLRTQPAWNSSIHPKASESSLTVLSKLRSPTVCNLLRDGDSDISHCDSGKGPSEDDHQDTRNSRGIGSTTDSTRPPPYTTLSTSSDLHEHNNLESPYQKAKPEIYIRRPIRNTDLDMYGTIRNSEVKPGQKRSYNTALGSPNSTPMKTLDVCTEDDGSTSHSTSSSRITDPYRTRDDTCATSHLRPTSPQKMNNNTIRKTDNISPRRILERNSPCNINDNLFYRDVYV